MKEEFRDSEVGKNLLNRSLRKKTEKVRGENNKRKFLSPGLHSKRAEWDEEKGQTARRIPVEFQASEGTEKISEDQIREQIGSRKNEKDSSCHQTWQPLWM